MRLLCMKVRSDNNTLWCFEYSIEFANEIYHRYPDILHPHKVVPQEYLDERIIQLAEEFGLDRIIGYLNCNIAKAIIINVPPDQYVKFVKRGYCNYICKFKPLPRGVDCRKRIQELESKVAALEFENESLRCLPGAPEYFEAQKHFEDLASLKNGTVHHTK